MKHAPKANSTAWHLISYFLINADEELTVKDAAIKFDVPEQVINRAVNEWPDQLEHVSVIRLKRRD